MNLDRVARPMMGMVALSCRIRVDRSADGTQRET
jgi:hypothetical protein